MIRFLDGPAAGVELSLRRAPVMLRVVHSPRGNWDALDQPGDTASPAEAIHVYRLARHPTYLHIRASGKGGKALSGFWATADYALLPDQPGDVHTRDNRAWAAWCDANRDALMPGFLRPERMN